MFWITFVSEAVNLAAAKQMETFIASLINAPLGEAFIVVLL